MDIVDAISGRRSTRAYNDRPVDVATIRRVIDAAVLAPSAINEQPWTFTVIQDQALLDRISLDAKAQMMATMPAHPMPPMHLAAGADVSHSRPMLNDPAFHIFYHAPVLILISGRAPSAWIVEDCSLAAENLMLMAHSLGLGTCWIGFAQRYLASPAGKQTLGLPESLEPVAPIILGHPSTATQTSASRKEPEIRWID